MKRHPSLPTVCAAMADYRDWEKENRPWKAPTERQLCRAQARRLGLAYWPSLYEGGCDPAAYVAAERILSARHGLWNPPESYGGWDSNGDNGLSAYAVKRMWFAAGCRNSEKFRYQVQVGLVAKKSDTLPGFRQFATGNRWLQANWISGDFSRNATRALGRLSPVLRWAAIQGLDSAEGRIRVRHLNWAEVQRVQGMGRWQRVKLPYIPTRLSWEISGLTRPGDLSWRLIDGGPAACAMRPSHLPPAEWRATENLVTGMLFPVLPLRAFWGKELPRAMTELYGHPGYTAYSSADQLYAQHNAGQNLVRIDASIFSDPSQLAAWRQLAWRTRGESLRYANRYAAIVATTGAVPQTLIDLRRASGRLSYDPVHNPALAELCIALDLSPDEFQAAQRLTLTPQADHSTVPGVSVSLDNLALIRLPTDDLRGPLLGHFTDCCQHPSGAGASCAREIWRSERAGTWVVAIKLSTKLSTKLSSEPSSELSTKVTTEPSTKLTSELSTEPSSAPATTKGSIVAQSYVWRDGDALVIDSIEALGDGYEVTELYRTAIRQTLGRFGISAIYLADTGSGVTRRVLQALVPDADRCRQRNPFSCPSSYTDAKWIVRVG